MSQPAGISVGSFAEALAGRAPVVESPAKRAVAVEPLLDQLDARRSNQEVRGLRAAGAERYWTVVLGPSEAAVFQNAAGTFFEVQNATESKILSLMGVLVDLRNLAGP